MLAALTTKTATFTAALSLILAATAAAPTTADAQGAYRDQHGQNNNFQRVRQDRWRGGGNVRRDAGRSKRTFQDTRLRRKLRRERLRRANRGDVRRSTGNARRVYERTRGRIRDARDRVRDVRRSARLARAAAKAALRSKRLRKSKLIRRGARAIRKNRTIRAAAKMKLSPRDLRGRRNVRKVKRLARGAKALRRANKLRKIASAGSGVGLVAGLAGVDLVDTALLKASDPAEYRRRMVALKKNPAKYMAGNVGKNLKRGAKKLGCGVGKIFNKKRRGKRC